MRSPRSTDLSLDRESHLPSRNTKRYGHLIGIDTLKLFTDSFEVSEKAHEQLTCKGFTGQDANENLPLYVVANTGEIVEGDKAYCNDLPGDVSVDIRSCDGLFVNATMPRLLDEGNGTPIGTSTRFELAVDALRESLHRFGIDADLRGAQVCRIDLCRNVWTEGRLSDYSSALDHCSFPRTEERTYEDGGRWWRNDSRQLLLYAKGEKEGDDPRVQRLEYRLCRAQAVREQLGLETVSGLASNFPTLRVAYHDAVDELIPQVESDAQTPRAGSDAESARDALARLIGLLKARSERSYSKALKALGACYLEEHGLTEDFLQAVREQSSRMTASRYRQTVEDLLPFGAAVSEKARSTTDLLCEFRRKLLR